MVVPKVLVEMLMSSLELASSSKPISGRTTLSISSAVIAFNGKIFTVEAPESTARRIISAMAHVACHVGDQQLPRRREAANRALNTTQLFSFFLERVWIEPLEREHVFHRLVVTASRKFIFVNIIGQLIQQFTAFLLIGLKSITHNMRP